jgi:tryptophan halogenase
MEVWKYQPPSGFDFPAVDEVFPAASYQYILFGMGFAPPADGAMKAADREGAEQAVKQAQARTRSLAASLPTNRTYLDALREAAASLPQKENMKG